MADDIKMPSYEHEFAERHPEIGVTTGLAWTQYGGEIMFIEATRMSGSGRTTVTPGASRGTRIWVCCWWTGLPSSGVRPSTMSNRAASSGENIVFATVLTALAPALPVLRPGPSRP